MNSFIGRVGFLGHCVVVALYHLYSQGVEFYRLAFRT